MATVSTVSTVPMGPQATAIRDVISGLWDKLQTLDFAALEAAIAKIIADAEAAFSDGNISFGEMMTLVRDAIALMGAFGKKAA
jgi:hypothetical protein